MLDIKIRASWVAAVLDIIRFRYDKNGDGRKAWPSMLTPDELLRNEARQVVGLALDGSNGYGCPGFGRQLLKSSVDENAQQNWLNVQIVKLALYVFHAENTIIIPRYSSDSVNYELREFINDGWLVFKMPETYPVYRGRLSSLHATYSSQDGL